MDRLSSSSYLVLKKSTGKLWCTNYGISFQMNILDPLETLLHLQCHIYIYIYMMIQFWVAYWSTILLLKTIQSRLRKYIYMCQPLLQLWCPYLTVFTKVPYFITLTHFVMCKTMLTRRQGKCTTGTEAQSSFLGGGHLPNNLSQFYDTPNSRLPVPWNWNTIL